MDQHQADVLYMQRALDLAEQAASQGEIPVGAVVVYHNQIVGQGFNLRETRRDPLAHAEMDAISQASRTLGRWRLNGCTLYVTMEPCPMCTGAILNARIDRVVFGTEDAKAGCFGSVVHLPMQGFNHRPLVTRGVLSDECALLLSDFFQHIRDRK